MTSDYRKRCLEAKGEECVFCTSTDGIEVHHVDGDHSNDSLENLIPVCEACHNTIHSGGGELGEFTERVKTSVELSLTEREEKMLQAISFVNRGAASQDYEATIRSALSSFFEEAADNHVILDKSQMTRLEYGQPATTTTETGESVIIETYEEAKNRRRIGRLK